MLGASDLIDEFGVRVLTRECSCCGEKRLFELSYPSKGKPCLLLLCGRCDVPAAERKDFVAA